MKVNYGDVSKAILAKAEKELAKRAVDPAHIACRQFDKALQKREFIEVAKGTDWVTFTPKVEKKENALEIMLEDLVANIKKKLAESEGRKKY